MKYNFFLCVHPTTNASDEGNFDKYTLIKIIMQAV